jgi:hypothetical protein
MRTLEAMPPTRDLELGKTELKQQVALLMEVSEELLGTATRRA